LTYRQLLRGNADFRRLWTGQVVSEIGDWLNNIAVLALTIQLAGAGHEGRAIALYAIARHLPLFLFGPVAGVVVDRTDRRRVMILADIARAVLALGFLLARSSAELPVIYLVGASLFAISAFFNVAKRAAIPNMVSGADELLTANSLSSSTTAATIAIGSALGGIVATLTGRDVVFILNALTFLVSALMIRRIRAHTRQTHDVALRRPAGGFETLSETPATRHGFRARPRLLRGVLRHMVLDFREGLRYVRRNDLLASIFIVAAGWGLGNGVARSLYSIFGARLGQAAVGGWIARPTDFGNSVLYSAMGLGGVLGALVVRRFDAGAESRLASRMGRSIIFDGCSLALFALMPSLWSAALVLIFREVNYTLWKTAQTTIMMSRMDDAYGGRVFASYETLTTLMMTGSMLASGVAADIYGIKPVTATGGIIIALSGLLWFVLRRRRGSTNSEGAEKVQGGAEGLSS
jgi:predicted MFS family arabinose efflux permease